MTVRRSREASIFGAHRKYATAILCSRAKEARVADVEQ